MKTIKNALSDDKIRQKILWFFGIIALVRILSQIPIPGIDSSILKEYFNSPGGSAFGLFSAFTGGSLESFSVFALGITPYITASIVVQLLGMAIRPLGNLSKEGEYGRRKTERITIAIALVMAAVQGTLMTAGFGKRDLIPDITAWKMILSAACITGGCALSICFARLLTKKSGVNGTSTLLMVNILSRFPDVSREAWSGISGKWQGEKLLTAVILAAVFFFVLYLVVYLTDGTRDVPLQFSQKMALSGGAAPEGKIPVKVGIVSVMPVIFASTFMGIPAVVAAMTGKGYGGGISKLILGICGQQNWFQDNDPIYNIGLLVYIALILFFAWFYTPIAFNGMEISDSIRKSGAFIPGISPGKDTESYLNNVAYAMSFIGTAMLITAMLILMTAAGIFHTGNALSVTSIIIIAGVILDILKQVRLDTSDLSYPEIGI